MLIALLAVLGVDLAVVVVLLLLVLARKRWIRRQPGAFPGAIRVADGDVDGLHARWVRGYGRWVRDVLVWTKAPLLLRTELIASDALDERRLARPGEIKRLGHQPCVLELRVGGAMVEVAARDDDRDLLAGAYAPVTGAAGR